jgi:hypothetical protein
MSPSDLFPPPPELQGEREGSAFRADLDLARRSPEEPVPARDEFLASSAGRRLLEHLAQSERFRRRRRRLAAVTSLAAAVAGIGFGLYLGLRESPETLGVAPFPPQTDVVRLKTGSSLVVFRKRGSSVAQVLEGAVLQPRDQLRFLYRTSIPYLMVVNLEAQGGVQPFYPHPAGESVRTTPDARVELPGSIELDQSVGTERIVAVFSERPLRFEEVRAAVVTAYPAAAGGRDLSSSVPLDLPGEVVSIRVEKRVRGGGR